MTTVKKRPVSSFPITFEWQTNEWFDLFEEQVALIKDDIKRALVEDKVIIYLSCPISARGGGYFGTNVEIAMHTERRLLSDWGDRFWILNPTHYQMESKEGTGLIKRHAQRLYEKGVFKEPVDVEALTPPPTGGDYMRMWTKVLVEDEKGLDLGDDFDGYYFIGPSDVRDFFTQGGARTVSAGVEQHFARKYAMDPTFRSYFGGGETPMTPEDWEETRKDFFRFYSLRASANFSMGCHDEWNIWVLLNRLRLQAPTHSMGRQITGYFDGKQISPAASEQLVSPGYALEDVPPGE